MHVSFNQPDRLSLAIQKLAQDCTEAVPESRPPIARLRMLKNETKICLGPEGPRTWDFLLFQQKLIHRRAVARFGDAKGDSKNEAERSGLRHINTSDQSGRRVGVLNNPVNHSRETTLKNTGSAVRIQIGFERPRKTSQKTGSRVGRSRNCRQRNGGSRRRLLVGVIRRRQILGRRESKRGGIGEPAASLSRDTACDHSKRLPVCPIGTGNEKPTVLVVGHAD